jgi:hypothetical protein
MEGMFITMALFILLPGLIIGAFILKFLARKIGEIEDANFKNSLLVEIIAGVLMVIILSPFGFEDIIDLGVFGSFIVYLIILTLTYTVSGKFIWKSSYLQSFKANIVWIVIFSIIITIMISYLY